MRHFEWFSKNVAFVRIESNDKNTLEKDKLWDSPSHKIPTIPTMQVNKNPIILLRRCARLWPASDIMYHMLSFRFRLLLDFLLHFFTPKKCFFSRKNITAFASSTFSLYSILKDECFLAGHSLKMNQPEFLTPLRNHTVEVGKNVTFECYVTGIEKYKVSIFLLSFKISHASRLSLHKKDSMTPPFSF